MSGRDVDGAGGRLRASSSEEPARSQRLLVICQLSREAGVFEGRSRLFFGSTPQAQSIPCANKSFSVRRAGCSASAVVASSMISV